jgi:hypothetical protein
MPERSTGMAEKIRERIRSAFGEGSAHEGVFDSLLGALKAGDARFYPSHARRIVPRSLEGHLDQALLWFSFGPLHILEMRFTVHPVYDDEHDLDGSEGLEAYLNQEYTEPASGNVISGPELARRMFPYYVLSDSFKQALREQRETR